MFRDKEITYDRNFSGSCRGAELIRNTITACGQDDWEQFIIILNSKNMVVGTNIVAVGAVDAVHICSREVFNQR